MRDHSLFGKKKQGLVIFAGLPKSKHLFMGMWLFVIFPFIRLAHGWSGFASAGYPGCAYQPARLR